MTKIHTFIAKNPKIAIDFLLLLLTTFLLNALLGDIFRHLNNYMFAAGGDGLKIHYCMDYYVKYGNQLYFDGYQYPTGAHIMNVEAPLFFLLLRWFCRNIYDISYYNVAIVNITMLSAYYISVWVMYRILRKHHLSVLFAVLFSLMITFFNPQVTRLTGHYFLSFPCVFPLMWYASMQLFEKKNTLKWTIILFLVVFIASFVHLYYFLMGGAFILACVGIHFLQNIRAFKSNILLYVQMLAALFIPLIIIQVWLFMTMKSAQETVKYPFGFLYYVADFRTIFLPFYAPENDFWRLFEFLSPRKWFNRPYANPANWEGLGFVGFVGFGFLFFFLYRILKYAFKKQFRFILRPILPQSSQIGIWAAVFVLLFSMGYPLNFLEDAEDKVGLLRQFRSLGRLAWAFYYVYMTVCAYYLYAFFRYIQIYSQGKLQKFAYFLMGFSLFISGLELFVPWKNSVDYMKTGNISQNYSFWNTDVSKLLADNGHKATDFQAVLALPYYHLGSEKFGMEGSWHSQIYSYTTARSTGLPLLNTIAARTPLAISCENIQLMSHPYIKKDFFNKVSDKRPFLLLYSHEVEKLSEGEKRLIAKSKFICKLNEMTYATLDLAAFETEQKQVIAQYKERKNANTLISKGNSQLSEPSDEVVAHSFGDDFWAVDKDFTHGFAFKKGNVVIMDSTLRVRKDSTEMELSFWVKIDINSNYLPHFALVQFEGEKEVMRKDLEMKFSQEIYKNWARGEFHFPLLKSGNRIYLEATNVKNFYLDNLLLRPKSIDVYTNVKSDSVFVLNNYPIGF